MTPQYHHRQWVILVGYQRGNFTGYIRKHKRRWWFFGDVCRDVKGRVHQLEATGARIQIP